MLRDSTPPTVSIRCSTTPRKALLARTEPAARAGEWERYKIGNQGLRRDGTQPVVVGDGLSRLVRTAVEMASRFDRRPRRPLRCSSLTYLWVCALVAPCGRRGLSVSALTPFRRRCTSGGVRRPSRRLDERRPRHPGVARRRRPGCGAGAPPWKPGAAPPRAARDCLASRHRRRAPPPGPGCLASHRHVTGPGQERGRHASRRRRALRAALVVLGAPRGGRHLRTSAVSRRWGTSPAVPVNAMSVSPRQ